MPTKPLFKRLGWLSAVGFILMLSVLFYNRYFLARPTGHGPAGPTVARAPFTKKWSDKKVRLIGIGDSITAGLGAKTKSHTFFNRLIKNPSDEFDDMRDICLSQVFSQLTYENLAISGSTSLEHLAVIEEKLVIQDPDVFGLVVMTSGGNDLFHSYGRLPPKECAMYKATLAQAAPWIAAYRARLGQMIERISACFPGGCEIYLGDIYDPTDGVGDAPSVYLPHWPDGLAIHAKYNEAIADCARTYSQVHIVPLYKTFLGHGSHCRQFWRPHYHANDPFYWYYDNIEDPNDRGYDAIRRIFLRTIVERSSLAPAFP